MQYHKVNKILSVVYTFGATKRSDSRDQTDRIGAPRRRAASSLYRPPWFLAVAAGWKAAGTAQTRHGRPLTGLDTIGAIVPTSCQRQGETRHLLALANAGLQTARVASAAKASKELVQNR
jgi:hypothetical protein